MQEFRDIATAGSIALHGLYTYTETIDEAVIPTVAEIDVQIQGLHVLVHGLLIRHVLFLKDNYFGAHNSFVTLDEFRDRMRSDIEQEDNSPPELPDIDEEPFEFVFGVELRDFLVELPDNFYMAEQKRVLACRSVEVCGRNSADFGQIQIDTVAVIMRGSNKDQQVENFLGDGHIAVDSITAVSNRLYGPGALAKTYISDWRIKIGDVSGEITPKFIDGLEAMKQSFVYGFLDCDNSLLNDPNPLSSSDPDLTVAQLDVQSLNLVIWAQNKAALQVRLCGGIHIRYDTLVNELYSSRAIVTIPAIEQVLVKYNASPYDYIDDEDLTGQKTWSRVQSLSTSVTVSIVSKTPQWEAKQREQLRFLAAQDIMTGRCEYLYRDDIFEGIINHRQPRFREDMVYDLPFEMGDFEDPDIVHDDEKIKNDDLQNAFTEFRKCGTPDSFCWVESEKNLNRKFLDSKKVGSFVSTETRQSLFGDSTHCRIPATFSLEKLEESFYQVQDSAKRFTAIDLTSPLLIKTSVEAVVCLPFFVLEQVMF